MASLFDLVNENPEFVDEQLHIRFKEIGLNRSFLGKVIEIDKNGPNGKVLYFYFKREWFIFIQLMKMFVFE